MYIRAKWRVMGIKWDIYSTSDRATTNISVFQNSTPWHVTSLNIILFCFIHIMTGVRSANCTFLWRAKISWVTPRLAGVGGGNSSPLCQVWFLIVFTNHSGSRQSERNQRAHTSNYYYNKLPCYDCLSWSYWACKKKKASCGHPANRPFQEVKQHILLFPAHHSLERAFLSPCRGTLCSLPVYIQKHTEHPIYILYFFFLLSNFFLISLFLNFMIERLSHS